MVMTNFLQKRKSVRDFKKKAVSKESLASIKSFIDEISSETPSVGFKLFENGNVIYEGLKGKAGYSGVMIEAPSYVALVEKDDSVKTQIYKGYYLEKLNTKIVDLDLDSCWITVDQVDDETKKNIFGFDGENVNYIIAFGYGVGKKLFTPETTSDRLARSEIVFKDEIGNKIDDEDLINLGLDDIFSSVRYAPSHKNAQPWRFVVKSPKVVLYMVKSEEDSRSLVDIGVVMFYFEEMAKTIGRYGKWTLELEDQGDYLKIGEFTM